MQRFLVPSNLSTNIIPQGQSINLNALSKTFRYYILKIEKQFGLNQAKKEFDHICTIHWFIMHFKIFFKMHYELNGAIQ